MTRTVGHPGMESWIHRSPFRCQIFMPDDAAVEKSDEIAALGGQVQRVRPVSIAHPGSCMHSTRYLPLMPRECQLSWSECL